MQIHIFGDTVQARLKHWRQEIARVSQTQLCDAVNRHLAKKSKVGVSTVSNYERSTEPRASFLAALKKAYPDLNLDWLISGEGKLLAPEREAAELVEKLHSDESRSVLGQLLEQPGLQRFRALPEPATHVVLAFLEEVRLSTPQYHGDHNRPWREFLQRFTSMFFEPLESRRHLATKEALSEHELTTYALAVVATLRPLVPAFRAREHPTITAQSSAATRRSAG